MQRRARRRGRRALHERRHDVVEGPAPLHGPVDELLGERALAAVEPARLALERAVGVGALLEHAPQHNVGDLAGGAHPR